MVVVYKLWYSVGVLSTYELYIPGISYKMTVTMASIHELEVRWLR